MLVTATNERNVHKIITKLCNLRFVATKRSATRLNEDNEKSVKKSHIELYKNRHVNDKVKTHVIAANDDIFKKRGRGSSSLVLNDCICEKMLLNWKTPTI